MTTVDVWALLTAYHSQNLSYATRHLTHPSFPYAPRDIGVRLTDGHYLAGAPPKSQASEIPDNASDNPSSRASGFSKITWPRLDNCECQFSEIVTYMADLVAILDQYTSGDMFCNSQTLISDQICFVQHCLLSLPTAAELPRPADHTSPSPSFAPPDTAVLERKQTLIYEAARLGCIAFSHIVTNPTSATSFPRLVLTRKLLPRFSSVADRQYYLQASRVGGITASVLGKPRWGYSRSGTRYASTVGAAGRFLGKTPYG